MQLGCPWQKRQKAVLASPNRQPNEPIGPAQESICERSLPAVIVAESDLAGNLKSEYVFSNGDLVARRDY